MDTGNPLYYYICICVLEPTFNKKNKILKRKKFAFSSLSWTKWAYNSYQKEAHLWNNFIIPKSQVFSQEHEKSKQQF